MKKFSIILCFILSFTLLSRAQVVIKAGSLITVKNTKDEIRAKNLKVGDFVEFEVSEDFKIHDSVIVTKGMKVYAKVLEAKKSGMAGTKGKLKIEFVYCQCGTTKIPLEGITDFSRKNKTASTVALTTFVATPLIFLTGQHAAIPKDYSTVVAVKVDTEL